MQLRIVPVSQQSTSICTPGVGMPQTVTSPRMSTKLIVTGWLVFLAFITCPCAADASEKSTSMRSGPRHNERKSFLGGALPFERGRRRGNWCGLAVHTGTFEVLTWFICIIVLTAFFFYLLTVVVTAPGRNALASLEGGDSLKHTKNAPGCAQGRGIDSTAADLPLAMRMEVADRETPDALISCTTDTFTFLS